MIRMLFGLKRSESSHFLVQNQDVAGTRFSTYGEDVPKGLKNEYTWTSGKPITASLPEPLRYEQDVSEELTDFLRTSTVQFLVSERLFEIVQQSSSCARAYSAEIFRRDTLVSSDYVSVNFENAWSCLDHKRSKYRWSTDQRYLAWVWRLRLDPSRIPKDEDLFRIEEFPTLLIASAGFKDRVEEAGISGVKFFDFQRKRIV